MKKPILTEVIFKGLFSSINFTFLSRLLVSAKEVRFNYPENLSTNTFDKINEIFHSFDYVDLVISTDNYKIGTNVIKNTFVNIGRNGNEFELLFYFDLNDVGIGTNKENVDHLRLWAKEFTDNYKFGYYVCQMDNASLDEYYFDSNGLGPLYNEENLS